MKPFATFTAGTILAEKFRVVRLLGSGGMGAVYEVENERLAKRCALKILHADTVISEEMLKRFRQEIKADGRIGNEHIVEVFDDGVLARGEPYVVMELLEGETLEERIKRKRQLDVVETCELLEQVCDGVQAAHDARIIHRDLKPANLFVTTRDGKPFVKVLDFGIAKFQDNHLNDMANTKEGTLLGTPYYLAPEQMRRDANVDARTDVYALGVILYECATGRPPYQAENLPHLGMLMSDGPEPLSALRPELPESFRNCVMQAMAMDKNRRFPTAQDLGKALRTIRAQVPAPLPSRASAGTLPVKPEHVPVDLMRQTEIRDEPHGLPPLANPKKERASVDPICRTEIIKDPPRLVPPPKKTDNESSTHQAPSRAHSRRLPLTIIGAIVVGAIAMSVGFEIADSRRVVDPVITVPTATETRPLPSIDSTSEKPPITYEPQPHTALPTGTASATAMPSSKVIAPIPTNMVVPSAKPHTSTDLATDWGIPEKIPPHE